MPTTSREGESVWQPVMILNQRSGNSRLIRVFLCCVILTLVQACERADSEKTPVITGAPSTSLPMPPISGRSLNELGWQLADGQRNVFSQYNGTLLILDFYATWCLPCRQSIPELVSLQERYRDKGVSVVGLNVGGPDDWAKVPEFARELKIRYTLAVPDAELSNFLLSDDPQIPQTFVFGRDGKLLMRLIGFSENEFVLLDETIEKALKNN